MLATIGHGTLEIPDFLELLSDASVGELVDVRSYPGSRRVPQFGREAMRTWVPGAGVEAIVVYDVGGDHPLFAAPSG